MDGERAPLTAPHRRRLGGGRATAGLCLAPASLLAVPQPVRQPRPAKSQELKAGFSREPVWAQKARWGFSCSGSMLAETRAAELEPSPLQAKAMLKG